MRPAVTSWFLLALTALAALLASGLDPGGHSGAGVRGQVAAGSPEQSTERADARVPFVGAVLGTAAPAAGAQVEPATGGVAALVGAPMGVLAQAPAQPAAPSYVVVGGSGRAPPVTSGT